MATCVYDGDGRQVKATVNGVTTLYAGAHFEVTNPGSGQTITKYYFAGASRIAMHKYTIPQNMAVEYFLSDHLGSTALTTNTDGAKISEIRYKPWGEVRYAWVKPDINSTPAYKLTDYTFTGQHSYMDDITTTTVTEGFGLMFYNARWYDPALGRFAQADTIVPDPYNSQSYDRYSYVRNNPLKYTDPSGHCEEMDDEGLCLRQTADGTYRVVRGGGTFVNPVEVAFANYILSGGDKRYLNGIPDVPSMFLVRSFNAAASGLGYGNFDPTLDYALDPHIAAGLASIVVDFVWGLGQSASDYIKGLEGSNSRAHAWDKHGPNASDDVLRQSNSPMAQTKFASGNEMASAVSETLAANMTEIERLANSGKAGTIGFDSPTVNYTGYYKGAAISGQATARVVFWYDGHGGWGLYDAYPNVYPSAGGR